MPGETLEAALCAVRGQANAVSIDAAENETVPTTIASTIDTLVTLTALGDDPVTILSTGLLNAGIAGDATLPWQIDNAGLIFNTSGTAIDLPSAAGSVTNQNGGAIAGATAISMNGAPGTVVNAGSIQGIVNLIGGGGVTNQSTGRITAFIAITGTNVSLNNVGSIVGGAGAGLGAYLHGGSVTNQASAQIAGKYGVFGVTTGVTVQNAGTIAGSTATGAGVVLLAGGYVTNLSGGVLAGRYGVVGLASGFGPDNGAASIVNAGQIQGGASANGFGIVLNGGGGVSNASTGIITGGTGIYGAGARPETLVNAGTIAASVGDGGHFHAGGAVTNVSGATISGYNGLSASDVLDVVNTGGISGLLVGIDLKGGGTVTNLAGGIVTGGQSGVTFATGPGVLRNAGTIAGSGTEAAHFAAGQTNRLIVDPGAVFTGLVDGGNTSGAAGISTLELAAGAAAGTLVSASTQFINFSQTTIDAGASWVLTGNNNFAAGTTLTNAGTITVLNTALTDDGSVVNNGVILIDPSTVTLASLTGTGNVVIAAGSTLNVSGTVAAGETIAFGAGTGALTIAPAGFFGLISGLTAGDAIGLTGITTATKASVTGGNTLRILGDGNLEIDLALDSTQDYSGMNFVVSGGNLVTAALACFAAGTRILTVNGQRAVETLAEGDELVTRLGGSGRIVWTGRRQIDLSRHPRPETVCPIRIQAGAFGPNVPSRDLLLSPDHAVYLDGVLIPVRLLVNGGSIRQVKQTRIVYHHIELNRHDVILAEGLPAESYLDTGGRAAFSGGPALTLHPDFAARQWEMAGCAPLVQTGPELAAARRRLTARAAVGQVTLPGNRRERG